MTHLNPWLPITPDKTRMAVLCSAAWYFIWVSKKWALSHRRASYKNNGNPDLFYMEMRSAGTKNPAPVKERGSKPEIGHGAFRTSCWRPGLRRWSSPAREMSLPEPKLAVRPDWPSWRARPRRRQSHPASPDRRG